MPFSPYHKNESYRVHVLELNQVSYHWRDTLLLLYVLEGEILVTIDDETHSRKKGQVDIINPGELRAFEGKKKNRVLFLELQPDFFADYYEEAPRTYYYVDERDSHEETEKYRRLKSYMAKLSYEYFHPGEDSSFVTKELLVELMYHLLNQFHYLYYEQEELREDRLELNRFHRIFTYLDGNFKERVSLQELADQEYLNPSYLSYKIKDTLGLSFHDYLNALRCEEGAKLLLETEKSMSEIALDVGFSHPRYFQKHFEEQYHKSPQEFREAYENKVEDYTLLSFSPKDVEEDLLGDGRYSEKKKAKILSVDLKQENKGEFQRSRTIFLGEASLYLESENQDLLKLAQREIGFDYAIVEDLFTKDMDIFRGKPGRFYNWTRVDGVLELLSKLGLEPILHCRGVEEYILEDFVETFSPLYPEVETWIHRDEGKTVFEADPLQDQLIGAARMIEKRDEVPVLLDAITPQIELDNDTFFGGAGLFTANYLSKPSFYVWKYLSLMGEEILHEGEGVLLTRSDEGIQLLLYAEKEEDSTPTRLNLFGMEEDMWISSFTMSRKEGSIYDAWKDLGSPERLSEEHWYLLNRYVHPSLDLSFGEKKIVYSIRRNIDAPSIVLYLFNKIQ